MMFRPVRPSLSSVPERLLYDQLDLSRPVKGSRIASARPVHEHPFWTHGLALTSKVSCSFTTLGAAYRCWDLGRLGCFP